MVLDKKVIWFLTVAETLNFSSAAEMLGVSQQAVSKAIIKLEDELGLKLFRRTRRSVVLTEAGAECKELFQTVRTKTDLCIEALRTASLDEPDRVVVGYQNYMEITDIISRGRKELLKRRTGLEVSVERYSPALLVGELEAGRLDLGILCGRFLPDRLRADSVPFMQIPLLFMVSENWRIEGSPDHALRRAPFIIDAFESESEAELVRRIEREVQLCQMEPERVVVVPNRDSAYAAAELGQGVLICTVLSRAIGVQGVKTFDTGVSDELICCRKHGDGNPAADEFVKILLDGENKKPDC